VREQRRDYAHATIRPGKVGRRNFGLAEKTPAPQKGSQGPLLGRYGTRLLGTSPTPIHLSVRNVAPLTRPSAIEHIQGAMHLPSLPSCP